MRKDIVLLDPKSEPVTALISALDQATLESGQWAQLDNCRIIGGLPYARGGMSASLGTVLASSVFRGIWTGNLFGTNSVVVALEVGGAVRIIKSSDMATWTEITAGSGQYGNTRMTAGNLVRFTYVTCSLLTSLGTDRLLACNGVDAPRAFSSSFCGKVEAIPDQKRVQDEAVNVLSAAFFADFQAPITESSLDTDFEFTVTGSDPNITAILTIATAVDLNDNATLTFSMANVTASDYDRQLLIGVDTAYSALWDKVKVELGGVTVWDASNPASYSKPFQIGLGDLSSKAIWVFQYPPLAATTTITTLKLTWIVPTAEAPTAAQTATFFCIALGYGKSASVPPLYADANLAVTMLNEQTGTESPGIIHSKYTTQRIKDIGGPVLNELSLPRDPRLGCVLQAPYYLLANTHRDAGVDKVVWYVRYPGQTRYVAYAKKAISVYSAGAWAYSAGSAGAVVRSNVIDDNGSLYNEYLPDSYHIPIPATSTEICFANDRLFAGGAGSMTISQRKNPFRCQQLIIFKKGVVFEDSPGSVDIPGHTIQAIIPMAASTAGASTILALSDKGIFAVQGQSITQLTQVGRVSEVGTRSPYSVVGDKGTLYFLDTMSQVRILQSGRMDSLTREIIDDKFKGIPGAYRQWVIGAVHNDTYYLAYTPSGQTLNTKIAVRDMNGSMWTTDTPPKPVQGLIPWQDGTNKVTRLIAIGSDSGTLKAYEYDLSTQSQDLGTTDISVTLEPFELHSPDLTMVHVGRCKAMIDDLDSRSATIVRTYYPTGTYQTTTMSLDTSNTQIYREDRIEGATVTGSGRPEGPRCRIVFTIPMTAGKAIRYLCVEANPRGGGQDRP